MKQKLLILAIAGAFVVCQNSSESAAGSDSADNSITPPPTADTANAVAPMMGDTAKTNADSLRK